MPEFGDTIYHSNMTSKSFLFMLISVVFISIISRGNSSECFIKCSIVKCNGMLEVHCPELRLIGTETIRIGWSRQRKPCLTNNGNFKIVSLCSKNSTFSDVTIEECNNMKTCEIHVYIKGLDCDVTSAGFRFRWLDFLNEARRCISNPNNGAQTTMTSESTTRFPRTTAFSRTQTKNPPTQTTPMPSQTQTDDIITRITSTTDSTTQQTVINLPQAENYGLLIGVSLPISLLVLTAVVIIVLFTLRKQKSMQQTEEARPLLPVTNPTYFSEIAMPITGMTPSSPPEESERYDPGDSNAYSTIDDLEPENAILEPEECDTNRLSESSNTVIADNVNYIPSQQSQQHFATAVDEDTVITDNIHYRTAQQIEQHNDSQVDEDTVITDNIHYRTAQQCEQHHDLKDDEYTVITENIH